MESYHIRGGNPISGEYTVKGAKNAALPILAASIVTNQENSFFNCPAISDVTIMKRIMEALGCNIKEENGMVIVDTRGVNCCHIPDELMKQMRSSAFLIGPLLTRCKEAVISQPGGCAIGKRPLDIHIKALAQMGAEIEEREDQLIFHGRHMEGTNIVLDFPSVGATENIITAALGAKGETVIHNSAKEPEIIDLQNYLNRCGAQITGAGTSVVTIKGRPDLHGAQYRIMGDRIEAGTFLLSAAGTGGELLLKGLDTNCLKSLLKILKGSGCKIKKDNCSIWIQGSDQLKFTGKHQTRPYPGLPTDLQPQLVSVMAAARGKVQVEETIFENRFKYVDQLRRMGADIEIMERMAIIRGVEFLKGTIVEAEDLRGGAALVLAGLMAEGETTVHGISYIDRGYCNFHKELKLLGGDIGRIE